MFRVWGDEICLIGNIDINKLTFGSPDEIVEEVREAIKVAAPGEVTFFVLGTPKTYK